MNNVISVLIPLIFANPLLARQTTDFLTITSVMNTMMLAKETDDVVLPRPCHRISASFCLDTNAYRMTQKFRGTNAPKSLSNSFIRRNGLLAGEKVAKIGRTSSFPFVLPKNRRTHCRSLLRLLHRAWQLPKKRTSRKHS